MAVREFDGTDDIITMSVGGVAISNFAQGNYSIVAVVKPASLSGTEGLVGVQIGASNLLCSLSYESTNQLALVDDNNVYGAVVTTVTAWDVIAITKTSGSSAPRMHRKPVGSGTWTHANHGASVTGVAGTPNRIDVGGFLDGGGFEVFKDCRLAVAAIFNTTLSDGQIEGIETAKTTQSIYDLTPLALWDFNQAATSTAVDDLIGTSDQSSLTGTTVINGDDPSGWTFGVGAGGPSQRFRWRD